MGKRQKQKASEAAEASGICRRKNVGRNKWEKFFYCTLESDFCE